MSTDTDWEKWGKSSPYYGVLSNEKFTGQTISDSLADQFYASGQNDVANAIKMIKAMHNGTLPQFKRAVDFGCGVGRITVPLAQHAKKTTGLDISPSMLEAARQNLPATLRKRITYETSDSNLTALPKQYDLVYSNIVLQHIPTKRGYRIISKLLDNLERQGFAALHVTYAHQAPRLKRFTITLRSHVQIVHYTLNALRGRQVLTPLMRMHLYDLDAVLSLFYDSGIQEVTVALTNHGGYLGAMIIGQKTADDKS